MIDRSSLSNRMHASLGAVLLACLSGCSGGGGGTSVGLAYSPPASGYPVGFPIQLAPVVAGAPTAYTIVAGTLPPGVSFNTSTGAFSGRPLVAESHDLIVRASDGGGSSDVSLTLHTVPPPAARFLYVTNSGDDLLSAYLVDAESGAARSVGVAPTGGEPRVVTVAPGSTHVAVGTKTDGISLYSIHPVHGRPKEVAGSPVPLGSEVRDLVFHPEGTHLYALAVSGASDDLLFQLEFDAATGELVPLSPPALTVPNGSTSLAVDPLGRALYLTHGAAVRTFTIAPSGALSAAGDSNGGSIPVDVVAAPDGSAIYALNFGSKDIWRFPTQADGKLANGSKAKAVASTFPISLCVTGDGGFVYVGDGTGAVEQFKRNANGSLKTLTPASVALGGDLRGLAADPSGAGAWATLGTKGELVALPADASDLLQPDLDTPVRTHELPLGVAAAPGATPAVLRAKSLYALNWEDDDFNQFAVAPDGRLSQLQPPLEPTGTRPENVVAHPFRDALYVSNTADTAQALEAFQLNPNGAASQLQPFGGTTGSLSFLIGLNGTFGHVVFPDAVAPVSISSSGQLTAIGTTLTAATSNGRAVNHPGGTWLYLPHGAASGVLSYSVNVDTGALTNTGGALADPGTNALAVEPTGRFLYAVNDSAGVDRVRGYAVDPTNGTLSELATSPYALPGQALDGIAVVAHPRGRVLYVATRSNGAVAGQGAVHAFRIETDPTSGAGLGGLTPLGQPTVLIGQQPHDLEVTPDGSTLYVSIEDTPGQVLAYSLNANGALSINPIDVELTGARTRGLGLRTLVE